MTFISKRVRAFFLVAEHSSVSEAARILSLTVSPVSRLITDMEIYYNRKLFKRQGNKISLTPEGEKLYHQLKEPYSTLERIEKNLKEGETRNVDNIFYNWGTENLVLQLHEKNILSVGNGVQKFFRIEDYSISALEVNSCYVLSRDIPSELHDTFIWHKKDHLNLYLNREISDHIATLPLILHSNQESHSAISCNCKNLQSKYGFKNTITIENEYFVYEMVKKGLGIGIDSSYNTQLYLNGNNNIIFNDTNIPLPIFIKIPKNECGAILMKSLSITFGEFTAVVDSTDMSYEENKHHVSSSI